MGPLDIVAWTGAVVVAALGVIVIAAAVVGLVRSIRGKR